MLCDNGYHITPFPVGMASEEWILTKVIKCSNRYRWRSAMGTLLKYSTPTLAATLRSSMMALQPSWLRWTRSIQTGDQIWCLRGQYGSVFTASLTALLKYQPWATWTEAVSFVSLIIPLSCLQILLGILSPLYTDGSKTSTIVTNATVKNDFILSLDKRD